MNNTEYKIVYRDNDIYKIIDNIFNEDSAYTVLAMVIKAGYTDCCIEYFEIDEPKREKKVADGKFNKLRSDIEFALNGALQIYHDAENIASGDITPKQRYKWNNLLNQITVLFTELAENNRSE